MARTRWPPGPVNPGLCTGQADQTGSAGGCQSRGPADRAVSRQPETAPADSEVRPDPRPDPTPTPPGNQGSRAEALSTSSLPRIVRAGPSSVKGTRRSFLKPLRRNDLQDPPLSAGDLCQPSGPDGEGQARGQARNARGEPQRLSEGRTGPSQLRVKPCGHAESFATLPSWLPQKLLIMNHFGLNYKRH
jgi:hypothetical protein